MNDLSVAFWMPMATGMHGYEDCESVVAQKLEIDNRGRVN